MAKAYPESRPHLPKWVKNFENCKNDLKGIMKQKQIWKSDDKCQKPEAKKKSFKKGRPLHGRKKETWIGESWVGVSKNFSCFEFHNFWTKNKQNV